LVLSGDRVATRMTAILQPLDYGRRTRVTAQVERGDAPDDFVSPAFRSTGITMGLFTMALESELNELVAPQQASAETCQALMDRFERSNEAAGLSADPEGLGQAVGQTAQAAIRLHAMEAELRRSGCSTENGGEFRQVTNTLDEGGSDPPPEEDWGVGP